MVEKKFVMWQAIDQATTQKVTYSTWMAASQPIIANGDVPDNPVPEGLLLLPS